LAFGKKRGVATPETPGLLSQRRGKKRGGFPSELTLKKKEEGIEQAKGKRDALFSRGLV